MNVKLACIGGRAAHELVSRGAFSAERLGPRATPFGQSQPVYRCSTAAGEFLLLCRHGERGYEVTPATINFRADVYALKDLDVEAVVSWSETRAISHNYTIGQYVIVDDLIDETVSRARTFFENQELAHIRNWPVFCPTLRKIFSAALKAEGCQFSEGGVYVCIEGPRRETPAEARKYEVFGGDLIGQTLAPEVFLAKELQMNYAALCFVSCYAETGTRYPAFESGRVLSEESLRQRAQAAVEGLPRILDCVCALANQSPRTIAGERIDFIPPNGARNGNWRSWFDSTSPSAATRGPGVRIS